MAFEIQVHQGVDHCCRQAGVRVLETDVDDVRFLDPLYREAFLKP